MSRSLGYTKKFIVLKKDFSNMAGLNPKGHGKIEIKGLKGSLSISLENAEGDQFYSVLVVNDNKGYEIGKVYTEKNGKGREDLTFNISDLEASGFSVDDLNGIIVKRGKDILLGGYLGKEDDSVQNYIKGLMTAVEPQRINEAPEERKKDIEVAKEVAIEAVEEITVDEVVDEEVIEYKDEVETSEEPQYEEDEDFIQEVEVKQEIEAQQEIEFIEEPDFSQHIVEEVYGEDEAEAQSEIEVIEGVNLAETLENIETDIEIHQFIETETDNFTAEFEPIMEINQEPEQEALEPEALAEAVADESTPIETEEIETEEIEIGEVEVEELDIEEVEALELIEEQDIELEVEATELEVEDVEQEAEDLYYDSVARDPGPEFEPLEMESVVEHIDPVAVEPESIAIEIEPMEYKVSKEEIVEISRMDYEQNRRIIQRDQTTNYVLNILRYFPHVDPFRINLNGYSWWRIDYQDEEKGFLPFFSHVVGGEKKYAKSHKIATSRDLMGSYAHYLFGLYNSGDEVKYYVYAIPGGFYKDEHPHGGVTGFNTWFPGSEISGYWLLYIDALTGKVIYPINPMIPTE